jgi:hypothetical protein
MAMPRLSYGDDPSCKTKHTDVVAAVTFHDGVEQPRQGAIHEGRNGAVRGAVVTVAPDGQSYNIPGASLKLKGGVHGAETSSNDGGEYEFTNVSPGEYMLK